MLGVFLKVCRLKANQSIRGLTDQPEERKYRLLTKAIASFEGLDVTFLKK